MALENLKHTDGAVHSKRIVGRGYGSKGKTAGRGQKGQGSRAGGGVRLGFAGGETPLYKRLAKRGFTHVFRKEYAIVNLSALNAVFNDNDVVDKEALVKANLVDKDAKLIKVLGNGEIEKALTVKVNKVSETAKEKIEKANGKVEVI